MSRGIQGGSTAPLKTYRITVAGAGGGLGRVWTGVQEFPDLRGRGGSMWFTDSVGRAVALIPSTRDRVTIEEEGGE